LSPISQILTFLKDHNEGASISEISTALGFNRNFAAKYLTTLYMQGQVDLRSYGKVRLYNTCNRVPFHAICLISDGIVLGIDRLGIIREVTGPVDHLFNYQKEELIGVQLKELKHPVLSYQLIQDQVRQLIERKGSKPFHRTILLGDRMFRITLASCIFNDAMTGVGILISDQTSEYMRGEPVISGLNPDFSLAHESSEFIVFLGSDEKIVFANPPYLTYCGLTIHELIGEQGLPFVSSQYMSLIREAYMSTTPEHFPGPVHIMALFPDGDIRWQEWTAYPKFTNKTLHQIHLHGKDITEQKYQEMEIRELRRGIAQLFDEKILEMREVTLRVSQEIEELKAENHRLKNRENLVSSLFTDHPVMILETESTGIVTSVTVPDKLSHIISRDQLIGHLLMNIFFVQDPRSDEKFFEFSGRWNLPFHQIPCHMQIGTSWFQVIISGMPLKRSDGMSYGMCIAADFLSVSA